MKIKMCLSLVGLTGALGLGHVLAAPLQRSDVMNDPAWVLHLDCDALRQTAMGKQMLAEMDKPDAQKKLAAFEAVFKVDLRKDLHGVTVYSATKEEPDGVVLAYADFDAERLISLVQANQSYESAKRNGHTIHNWIDDKKKEVNGVKPRTYGAIYKNKIIVVGQKESRVAEALAVLDGKQPDVTKSATFAPLAKPGPGTIVQAAARKLNLPGNDPGAAVFKQAKMIWLNFGERAGKAELKLNLDANSTEVAQQMVDVAKGLIAVMALQTDKPEAVKLAKAATVDSAAASVAIKFALPAADVVQMIKDKAAEQSKQD